MGLGALSSHSYDRTVPQGVCPPFNDINDINPGLEPRAPSMRHVVIKEQGRRSSIRLFVINLGEGGGLCAELSLLTWEEGGVYAQRYLSLFNTCLNEAYSTQQ